MIAKPSARGAAKAGLGGAGLLLVLALLAARLAAPLAEAAGGDRAAKVAGRALQRTSSAGPVGAAEGMWGTGALLPAVATGLALEGVIAPARSRALAQALRREHARIHGVSLTPSRTKPYWLCPERLCDGILDPTPARVANGFALPQGRALLPGNGELGGYGPQELESAYKIPVTGGEREEEGQTIALIEAGAGEALEQNLATYRERYGLPPCTEQGGCLRIVNQQGEAANYPRETGAWATESAADVDMASAACPHCHLLVVEASEESCTDYGQSVNEAVALGATEVSNSYGLAEQSPFWCPGAALLLGSTDYNHPGVVITASAGDYGYKEEVQFPAAAPDVVSVGGTSLRPAPSSRGWSEEVWWEEEATEGGQAYRDVGTDSGCSQAQPKPAWQQDHGCEHRTDNDVAAVAACSTPVSIYRGPIGRGRWSDFCGTSAAAPLVAGIMAHESPYARSLGAAAFYDAPGSTFAVAEGSNGTCTPPAEDEYLCRAGTGYSGPAGMGTPDGVPQAPAPTVTEVTPNAGPLGGATEVSIDGTTFTGAVEVRFGATVLPPCSETLITGCFTVLSDREITALSPPGAGTVDVSVANPVGTSTADPQDRFSYLAAPAVTKVTPAEGPAEGATRVSIAGEHLEDASTVRFGEASVGPCTGGETTECFSVESANAIAVAAPPHEAGTVQVGLSTPGGSSPTGGSDSFTYLPIPIVRSVEPASGPLAAGTPVTITGEYLDRETEVAFVAASGERLAPAQVRVLSPEEITVDAPAAPEGKAQTVDLRLRSAEGESGATPADRYRYAPPPSVSAVEPSSGTTLGGETLTIRGEALGEAHEVKLGERPASEVKTISPTELTAMTPAQRPGTGAVDVTVLTPGGTSAAQPGAHFTYLTPKPVVESLTPTEGPLGGGTVVRVTGENLEGATEVAFGSTAGRIVSVESATEITAAAPEHTAGTVPVTVTTPGGTSGEAQAAQFTYRPGPVVKAIEPAAGPLAGDTPVTIIGENLQTAREVRFGTAQASDVVAGSGTAITAVSPEHVAGTVPVTVATAGGISAEGPYDEFTYVGSPRITALTPDEGSTYWGTEVTIRGENLLEAQSVRFGELVSTEVQSRSANELTAISPAHAPGVVDVLVSTPYGESSGVASDRYTFISELEGGEGIVPIQALTSTAGIALDIHGSPRVNHATGAAGFTVSVPGAGALRWLLTFRDGAFGVLSSVSGAAETHCKQGELMLRGRCRPSQLTFGRGGEAVAAAGTLSFTARPSRAARRALARARAKGRGLWVSVLISFTPKGASSPTSRSRAIAVRLRKASRARSGR